MTNSLWRALQRQRRGDICLSALLFITHRHLPSSAPLFSPTKLPLLSETHHTFVHGPSDPCAARLAHYSQSSSFPEAHDAACSIDDRYRGEQGSVYGR